MNASRLSRLSLTLLLLPGALLGAKPGRAVESVGAPVVVANADDVMNGQMPALPAFPKLTKKHGTIRGYVKDVQGKPVADAYIMVTMSESWGWNKNVSARTDENGYYEMAVPFPVAQVWCAGYATNLYGVRMALPLHPVTGRVEHFTPSNGEVENFVLLPYGVADPAGAADNSRFNNNYYGGSLSVSYWTGEGPATNLPEGATLEVTLTPDGPLLGNVPARTFVMRQTTTGITRGFQMNDIPLGRYKVTARLIRNGSATPLHLRDNGHYGRTGAVSPREADGSATLLFPTEGADEKKVHVPYGNNQTVELLLQLPG